uniref:Periodic tryptophan protein 2 homolog n=1 Tax=Hydra vulgaris TaxID=6087 RepID=T2MD28_HYDVU
MKIDYKFQNLCGTVYRKGNVIFTSGGDSVLSPVGNRVTCFDLKNNKSVTLPFENGKNISRLCISPNNNLLLSIDEDGKCVLFNLQTNYKLDFFSFKKKVYAIKYSPNSKYIAVTYGRGIQIWKAPGTNREFTPLTLMRTCLGAYDDTKCIDWSDDSRFLAVGGKDMTVRIYSVNRMKNFRPFVLTGHRSIIINCFLLKSSLDCYSVSRDGAVFVWRCYEQLESFEEEQCKRKKEDDLSEDYAKWRLESKHFFYQNDTSLTCAEFHKGNSILVVGFSSGIFMLYEMPDFIQIHSLSITQHKINSIAISNTSEWLAFGSSTLGQLLVWEWQSETYVLKQQGHFYDMNVMAYSPDGQFIATGGDDGKVKMWNTISGFCFVTFHEHSAGISGVEFSQNGKVIVTSSLDGTVRAFDLNRYRNFRTFTSPRPAQFCSLSLDSSGEIVCAGSLDTFEIFMWSMQTGRLLEILSGHEGPVSCLAFSPIKAMLVSGSWDNTVRLWNVYDQTSPKETITIGSNVTAIAFRPDGYEIAVSALDGEIKFWQPNILMEVGSIEGRKDLGTGRKKTDLVTAKHLTSGRCFTSLCYSADGQCVLAGGRSKYVCIYHVEQQILLRRFGISSNRSLDGMMRYLHSKNISSAGAIDMIDLDKQSDDDDDSKNDISLPGVKKGDMCSRKVQPEIQTKCLRFSPTGRQWSAATTEGLLIFSLDGSLTFRPEDLDIDVTLERITQLITEKNFALALNYAFRLNEHKQLEEVVESIPICDIAVISKSIREDYISKMICFVGKQLEASKHIQFYLTWTKHLLSSRGVYIKNHSATLMPDLRLIQKSLIRHSSSISSICEGNYYSLKYILSTKMPNVSTENEDILMEE